MHDMQGGGGVAYPPLPATLSVWWLSLEVRRDYLRAVVETDFVVLRAQT